MFIKQLIYYSVFSIIAIITNSNKNENERKDKFYNIFVTPVASKEIVRIQTIGNNSGIDSIFSLYPNLIAVSDEHKIRIENEFKKVFGE